MKTITRILMVCAVAMTLAGSAFAQLSAEYRDWAKGPVQYILTPQELQQWNQIKTDAEAKAFVDLFWAKRDPSAGTPANEYQLQYDQLVAFADKNFAEGRRKGSLTERGRTLILLGPPSRIERTGAPTTQTNIGTTATTGDQPVPTQVWIYDAGKSPVLGQQAMRVTFTDQFGNNAWTLLRGGGVDFADMTRRNLAASVVNPNLTQAPAAQAAAPSMTEKQPGIAAPTPQATSPAAAPAPASPGAYKTESLKNAVDSLKTAKSNPYKPMNVTYTEMLTPLGDYFVPVQLYVPKSSGVTADQVATFFGTIEDSTGTPVAIFEEPAIVASSNGDLYFDKSLQNLKPGTYRATVGLADREGKPVVMSSQPLELKGIAKEETGITRLVLTNDVHETEAAALVGAPYAFGHVKLVPKGDNTFTNKDNITYFVEMINPGLDPATNQPKIQVKLELVQLDSKGKATKTIPRALVDVQASALSGTPGAGQYAIFDGIPLGDMKTPLAAGDYVLRVKVYDQVKKQSFTAEQNLKLVNAPGVSTAESKTKSE